MSLVSFVITSFPFLSVVLTRMIELNLSVSGSYAIFKISGSILFFMNSIISSREGRDFE